MTPHSGINSAPCEHDRIRVLNLYPKHTGHHPNILSAEIHSSAASGMMTVLICSLPNQPHLYCLFPYALFIISSYAPAMQKSTPTFQKSYQKIRYIFLQKLQISEFSVFFLTLCLQILGPSVIMTVFRVFQKIL